MLRRRPVELVRRRVRVLDAAVPAPHHEEGVVLVRDLADQLRGGRHHGLQVRHHFRPVDVGRHVLNRHVVRHALHLELQVLLVADQDRAIVQHVEIRRLKGVCFALYRFQPGRDLLPVRRQLDRHRHRLVQLPGEVHEHAGRRNVRAILAQVVIGRERRVPEYVVVQHDRGSILRHHPPRILRDLLPRAARAPTPSAARKLETFRE